MIIINVPYQTNTFLDSLAPSNYSSRANTEDFQKRCQFCAHKMDTVFGQRSHGWLGAFCAKSSKSNFIPTTMYLPRRRRSNISQALSTYWYVFLLFISLIVCVLGLLWVQLHLNASDVRLWILRYVLSYPFIPWSTDGPLAGPTPNSHTTTLFGDGAEPTTSNAQATRHNNDANANDNDNTNAGPDCHVNASTNYDQRSIERPQRQCEYQCQMATSAPAPTPNGHISSSVSSPFQHISSLVNSVVRIFIVCLTDWYCSRSTMNAITSQWIGGLCIPRYVFHLYAFNR